MTFSTQDISVIICAYTEERWDDLIAAVKSVQQQSLPPCEIIVVVDHNPALLERAHTEIASVTVIENCEQRGLSGARNSGISVARGDIIAFMDEDAVAEPDWLAQLIVGYADPQVIGVGGSIMPNWVAGQPKWFPEEFNWVVGCTYRGMPEVSAQVRNLIGCNMSFRREVFDTVGGFRDGIGRIGAVPLGCEETELCIRINQRWPQAILRYDPQARVTHRVPAKRAAWNYFRARCYAEGRSKALISWLVGAGNGLASERTYTFRTLPRGIAHGFIETVCSHNLDGFYRSAAIVFGLVTTTTGYVTATLAGQRGTNSSLSSESNVIGNR